MYKFIFESVLAGVVFYVCLISGIHSLEMAVVFLGLMLFAELFSNIIRLIHDYVFDSEPVYIVDLIYSLIGSWIVMYGVLYFVDK